MTSRGPLRGRLLRGASGLVAVTVLTAGCSVAGTGFRPGTAAEVNGSELDATVVDDYADSFCTVVETGAFGELAVPRSELRQGVAGNLVLKLAAEQFAEEYGVEPGSPYRRVRTQVAQQAAALPSGATEALVEVQSAESYVNEVVLAAGREALLDEGRTSPSPGEAAARGAEMFAAWLDEQQIEIDPSLGIEITDGAGWAPVDNATSVAASSTALLSSGSPVDAAGAPDPEYTAYVASLPQSQRCGA